MKYIKLTVLVASLIATTVTVRATTNSLGQTLTTNAAGQVVASSLTPDTNSSIFPALPGIFGVIVDNLIDDAPYVTNGKVSIDAAALFNSGNAKGTGHIGFYGDVLIPMSQQSSVGIGGGLAGGHSFITPVTINVGTTLTNLPAIIGKVYAFAGDGVLYDFTGKNIGNWVCAGFFKSWTINQNVSLGLKFGTYNDSVIPGIGWFGGFTGTF